MKLIVKLILLLAISVSFYACNKGEPAKFTATENLTRGKNNRWALQMVISNDTDTMFRHIRANHFRVKVLTPLDSVRPFYYDTISYPATPTTEYSIFGTVTSFDFQNKKSEFYWKWSDDTSTKLVHFTSRGDSTFYDIEELRKDYLRMKFTSTDTLVPGTVSYIFK